MSEHTPGPWFYDLDRQSIGCDAGWIVGGVWHDRKGEGEFGDLEADMRYIVTAANAYPHLLEACKAAADYLEGLADSMDDAGYVERDGTPCSKTVRDNELAMCRAAIAKGEGL